MLPAIVQCAVSMYLFPIIKIKKNTNDFIQQGETILILEAMKMETMLTADFDVVIKAVHVKPGEVIAVKDLLVEYE